MFTEKGASTTSRGAYLAKMRELETKTENSFVCESTLEIGMDWVLSEHFPPMGGDRAKMFVALDFLERRTEVVCIKEFRSFISPYLPDWAAFCLSG